jgi:hypothetical protein
MLQISMLKEGLYNKDEFYIYYLICGVFVGVAIVAIYFN